jgi:CRP-like cAMP-binding protein
MAPAAREFKDRGTALLVKGKAAAALDEFRKAVQADPQDFTARRKVAEVLARLGKKPEAIAEYQALAGRLAVKGRLLEAAAIAKVILTLDPKHTQTQAALKQFAARHAKESWKAQLPEPMAAQLDHPTPASGEVEIVGTPIETLPLLPREVMAELLRCVELRPANAGEDIVVEGERGDAMFVVVEGVVEVVRGGKVVDAMATGAVFGEIALLAAVPRLATVRAAEDCLLIEVPRHVFDDLAERHPHLRPLMLGFFKERLVANLLRSNDLFRAFSPEELKRIADRFQVREAKRGEALITQGANGSGFWLILRGKCVAFDVTSGAEYPELSEGAVFGEIALLELCPATATVRAETSCVLLFLDRDSFHREVLQNAAASKKLDALVHERLARTGQVRAAYGPALV